MGRGIRPPRAAALFVPRGSIGREGSIPAPAGNTEDYSINNLRHHPVHPRTCGEHLPRSSTIANRCGSSPHLRRTLYPGDVLQVSDRFIPAPAENTLAQPTLRR